MGQVLALIQDALRVEKELPHPLVALFGGAKQLAQLMNFLTEIGYGHGGELNDFLLGGCWLYVLARGGSIPGFQSQATCRPATSSIGWSATRMAIPSTGNS